MSKMCPEECPKWDREANQVHASDTDDSQGEKSVCTQELLTYITLQTFLVQRVVVVLQALCHPNDCRSLAPARFSPKIGEGCVRFATTTGALTDPRKRQTANLCIRPGLGSFPGLTQEAANTSDSSSIVIISSVGSQNQPSDSH